MRSGAASIGAAHRKRLMKRAKVHQRRAAWLVDYLKKHMVPGESYGDGTCQLLWRRSEAIEITDEEALDEKWIRTKVERSPNKQAIMAEIKAGGVVAGAERVVRQNLQVK